MGLDAFSSDDNDSSSSSSDSSTSTEYGRSDPSNKPGYANAAFAPDEVATPRQIKYQVRTWALKWKKHYSHMRLDGGEVVLYTAGQKVSDDGKAVVVFTTIQSPLDKETNPDTTDIWVVPWDLANREKVTDGTYINHESDWKREVKVAIGDALKAIGQEKPAEY